MIDRIKNWLFYREFDTPKHVKHTSVSINPVSSICILFDGTNEDDRKKVHQLKKTLNLSGKRNIKSLAFIDNSLPLDNIDYAAYNQKNVKWYGIPFGEKVEEFIHFNFDILIVLCKKMLPHYEYIIAHSEAKFIMGTALIKAEKYFNLMVDTGESQDIDDMISSVMKGAEKIAIK
jgi:hypothetical protein